MRQQGSGTLVLTGNNRLTGATLIDAGTLQIGDGGATGGLAGNVANNGALIFNRSDDIAYAGSLSGSGATRKLGAGTLTLSGDSSAYTGAASIVAGTLQVDGKLGGKLLAASGATLSGTGTLNNVIVASGATLAPGSAAAPMGAMKLLGDLTLAPARPTASPPRPTASTAASRRAARPRWPARCCTWAPTATTRRPPPTPS